MPKSKEQKRKEARERQAKYDAAHPKPVVNVDQLLSDIMEEEGHVRISRKKHAQPCECWQCSGAQLARMREQLIAHSDLSEAQKDALADGDYYSTHPWAADEV